MVESPGLERESALSPLRPHITSAIVAALLLAIPGAAAGSGLSWGLRAGMSAARLHGSYGGQLAPDYRAGPTAGFYGALSLGSGFALQPEIALVSKGGHGDLRITMSSGGSTQVFDYHTEIRTSYFEVPLLLRFDVATGGLVEPYLIAGPAPAWRAGEGTTVVDWEVTTTGSPGPRPARVEAQVFEEVGTFGPHRTDSFDLGLVGGVGIRLGRGRVRLGLEGRYTRGVLDVSPWAADTRNAAFAFTTAIEVR